MYEIKKNIKTINGRNMVTYSRTIKDGVNVMEVESGSTGNIRPDGITYFRINNISGMCKFAINPIGYNGSDGVEIVMYGSPAISLLLIGLKFIRRSIIDCLKGKIH